MKKLTLKIEENQYQTFLSFLKTLDYVSILDDEFISERQLEEINRRLALLSKGEMKARPWDEAKKDLFKK